VIVRRAADSSAASPVSLFAGSAEVDAMAGGQRRGHLGPRSEELLEILPTGRLEIEGREAQVVLLRGDDPSLACAVERDGGLGASHGLGGRLCTRGR
jgi:hypothetical protein